MATVTQSAEQHTRLLTKFKTRPQTQSIGRDGFSMHRTKQTKSYLHYVTQNPCTKKRSIQASLHVKINKKIVCLKHTRWKQNIWNIYEDINSHEPYMQETCETEAWATTTAVSHYMRSNLCKPWHTMASASSRHSLLPTNNIKLLHHRWYRSWEKWRYLFSFIVYGSHFNHQTSLCPLREK